MKDKPEDVFANLAAMFNTYVDATTSYFQMEDMIRRSGFVELKDLADRYEVYISDDTTLDQIRESILSTMKAELHNMALQFKKFGTAGRIARVFNGFAARVFV